jgi:hypothetical protein
MIQSIIEAINQYRKIRVDLLGQNAVIGELKSNPGIKHTYSYGDGFFSLDTIDTYLTERLNNKAYDFILLPMANNHLEGYRNVIEVARLIEPKFILGIYPEGNTRVIEQKKDMQVLM